MTPWETTTRTTTPADDSNWKDNGCELFSACLNCPFPQCIEEKPRGRQKFRMLARAGQIVEQKRRGKSTREIAVMLGLSQRTVQRVLKASGGTRNG